MPDVARHQKKLEHIENWFNLRWKAYIKFGRWDHTRQVASCQLVQVRHHDQSRAEVHPDRCDHPLNLCHGGVTRDVYKLHCRAHDGKTRRGPELHAREHGNHAQLGELV